MNCNVDVQVLRIERVLEVFLLVGREFLESLRSILGDLYELSRGV